MFQPVEGPRIVDRGSPEPHPVGVRRRSGRVGFPIRSGGGLNLGQVGPGKGCACDGGKGDVRVESIVVGKDRCVLVLVDIVKVGIRGEEHEGGDRSRPGIMVDRRGSIGRRVVIDRYGPGNIERAARVEVHRPDPGGDPASGRMGRDASDVHVVGSESEAAGPRGCDRVVHLDVVHGIESQGIGAIPADRVVDVDVPESPFRPLGRVDHDTGRSQVRSELASGKILVVQNLATCRIGRSRVHADVEGGRIEGPHPGLSEGSLRRHRGSIRHVHPVARGFDGPSVSSVWRGSLKDRRGLKRGGPGAHAALEENGPGLSAYRLGREDPRVVRQPSARGRHREGRGSRNRERRDRGARGENHPSSGSGDRPRV